MVVPDGQEPNLDAIRARLTLRDEHHSRCSFKRTGKCDCYAKYDLAAHVALDALLAALAQLRAERDEALAALKDEMQWDGPEMMKQHHALRAERDAAVEALRRIAEYEEAWPQDPSDVYEEFQSVARAALAPAVPEGTQT